LGIALALLPGTASAQSKTRSPHGNLSLECSACHTSDRWVPVSRKPAFRHEKVGFPLEGSHAQVSCRSCHKSLVFNQVGTACIDCHKDPHKGSLGSRCESCHTPKTFATQLEILKVHERTRLPLFALHAAVACESCHRSQKPTEFAATPTDCAACHQKTLATVKNPNHALAGFTQGCEQCHTATSRGWRPSTFKHPASFPLRSAHALAQCAACHATRFKGTPRDCASCHLQAFNSAKNPNHIASGFPTQCEACHRESGWRPATFTDHGRTRFPLTGAHQKVDCARCHVGGKFTGTATECLACHQAKFQATQSPSHAAAGFSTDCATCHTTNAWQPAAFDHNKTRFPLSGAHQKLTCTRCHNGGKYKGTPADCYSCHQADYRRTTNPNHAAAGFPTQCAACHGTSAWRPASGVDHDKTRFPLTGAHRRVDCAKCHAGGQFKNTPTACYSCHQASYQATKNPDHIASGYPTTCASCHNTNAWKPASGVDHDKTRFPLSGAHRRVDCARCHVGGKYTGTPTDCYACHQANYRATTNPNHVAGGFSTQCTGCHTTSGWRPASFTDHSKTRFPLTGAHQRVDCARCHVGGRYTGTPTDCYSCHQANFQATKNPNHVAGGFSTQCATCHTNLAWRPASFNDHNKTRFPLTGAHQRVDCARCHVGGRYTGTSTDCFACHQANYQGTKNPNHAAAGFATQCQTCHTTSGWVPASFDHNRTRFPLAGAHRTVDCQKCHTGGRYAGTPADCYSCHQANYQGTKNPNHVTGAFPTACAGCHTVNGWRPATFSDHNKTRFPLTGAHQRVDCARCHVGGRYTGTPTDCYACHQATYQGAKNPNHVAAGFPTACLNCHTTNAWRPATFDHGKTRFPLAGAHQRVDCAKCHVGGRYAGTPTDCYSCHQSNYQGTKNPNHVAGGFPTQCQNCHNVNAWRPASFSDHSKTRFPLTGAHQRVDCAQCHVGGKYTGTPTDCYACHQAKYQATKNPNHIAAGFPTTCTNCHTTNAWTPANFDHGKTRFPLTGRHQTVTCAQCHVGGRYTGTPADCYACHQAKYQGTKNPNHAAAGFPTTCASCHTTSGWTPANFDHGKTRFPLTGRHQSVSCAQCHVGGKYTGTSTDCYACHQAKYQATTNPNHAAAGFPTTCASCHTTNGWTPANFDHAKTRFPLTGRHQSVSCAQCHVGGKYTGTSTDCYACHQAKYQGTKNPNHAAAGFPTTCASCHTTNGWTPANFDHGKTRFPLTGRHQSVSCAQCHVGGKYTGTSTDCYVCHQAKYQATTNPNHAAAGFPTTCTTCHTTSGWTPATFDHDARYFPIYSGKHKGVWQGQCATCHVTPANYHAFECILCHQHSDKAKVDGDHRGQAGYAFQSAACYRCHPRGSH